MTRHHRVFLVLCAVALLALGVLPAAACYSGLTIIPTADTVARGEYAINLQVDGDLPTPSADTYIVNTQFGLTDRLEAGVDFDLTRDADPRTFFNAKYVMFGNIEQGRALAVGITGIARHLKSNPYAVATVDVQAARAHLGAMRIENKTRWFVGADRDLTDRVSLLADYTSGEENYSSVGVNYQFTDGVGLLAGVEFPNGGGESRFSLQMSICGTCCKVAKE